MLLYCRYNGSPGRKEGAKSLYLLAGYVDAGRYNDSPGRKEGAKSLYLLAGCVDAAELQI
jgi:hypothetical protein